MKHRYSIGNGKGGRITTIEMIKMVRLFIPGLGLKKAKQGFEAAVDVWISLTGLELDENTPYFMYFLLLYILGLLDDEKRMNQFARTVPKSISPAYWGTLYARASIKNSDLIEENNALVNCLADISEGIDDIADDVVASVMEEIRSKTTEEERENFRPPYDNDSIGTCFSPNCPWCNSEESVEEVDNERTG